MILELAPTAAHAIPTTVLAQQTTGGGTGGSSVIMLAMLAALAVLMVLNARRAKKARARQEELLAGLAPGQEVMLAAGVYGRLVGVDAAGQRARVEIAPGTVVEVHRQAIAEVVEAPTDGAAGDPASAASAPESGSGAPGSHQA